MYKSSESIRCPKYTVVRNECVSLADKSAYTCVVG